MTSSNFHTPAEKVWKEIERIEPKKELDEWVLSKAEKSYIIYDRKCNIAVCSGCGGKIQAKKIVGKHNDRMICPCCGKHTTLKAYGRGRRNLTERFRVLVPMKRGRTIYLELVEMTINFEKMQPTVYRCISAVYKINRKELTYYKYHYGFYTEDWWELRKKIKLPARLEICRQADRDEVYPVNWKKLTKGTILENLEIERFVKYKESAYALIGYIDAGYRYPAIEMMFKGGLEKIAADYAMGCRSEAIYIRGKTLRKILRGTMEEVRDAREEQMSMYQYEVYRDMKRKTGQRLNYEVSSFAYSVMIRIEKDVKNMDFMRKIDWKKAKKYTEEKDIGVFTFADHLIQITALGYPVKARHLFPKDFARTHELMSEMYMQQKNQIKQKQYEEAISKFSDFKEGVEIGSLTVILPASVNQIVQEGKNQHHCVATYTGRVSRGDTLIFFVRRNENLNQSYYTLELSPEGKIRQCRGLKNCSMTEEVASAVEQFSNLFREMLKIKKKERRKVS